MSAAHDVYRDVTDQVIAALERGVLPWQKPWAGIEVPINAVSRRPYRGINILTTTLHQVAGGYRAPAFLTFNQAKTLGGWVRKGERGARIVCYRPVNSTTAAPSDELDEPASPWFVVRGYTVFNIEQCGGLEDHAAALVAPTRPDFAPLAECERLVLATGATIDYTATRAAYRPSDDTIYMPPRAWFRSRQDFYGTLFHELAHWTGAPHRLDRRSGARFGDPRYAFEELVAEMASAFVCSRVGIPHIDQAAAYLDGWLAALRAERSAIFAAAKLASAAADYLYMPTTYLVDQGAGAA